jgi:hypothetical protein
VTICIVESDAPAYPEEKLLLYIKLLFIDLFLIALIGGFILPAKGKWATGIHWYALLATLAILNLIFISAFKQWLDNKMQLRYEQVLDNLATIPQKYENEAKEKLKADKNKLPHHYRKIFIVSLITFIAVEIILVFVLWLFQ